MKTKILKVDPQIPIHSKSPKIYCNNIRNCQIQTPCNIKLFSLLYHPSSTDPTNKHLAMIAPETYRFVGFSVCLEFD